LSASERTAILRILDASANRAAEGLRVVEDYLRFVLDNPLLTDEVKKLRHDLAEAVSELGRSELVAARDIRGDVGVDIKTEAEMQRGEPLAVLSANLHRAAQALRSLGEYSKIVAPQVAPRFETIRYHVYQLESTIASGQAAAERLAKTNLYVLVDGRDSHDAFVAFIDALLSAGVHAIQLRDKNLSDRELVDRGRAVRQRIARFGTDTLLIVNDRPDLAVLCDADGVHVGQDELTVADARKIVGPRRLVGVSTHSIDQAHAAVLEGASYIGVGPAFASTTKDFAEFPGVALLAEVAQSIRVPAFAIGGITLDNLDQVLATGIRRVAIGAAITAAANPAAETRKWLKRLDGNAASDS
jgi:thiamine-phosphate pyrophosphorylase